MPIFPPISPKRIEILAYPAMPLLDVAGPLQAEDDRFDALHDWMGQHLGEDLNLTRLAQQVGMSERSFSRHYVQATGITPARAVERLRVDAARRLLCETPQPIKRIGQRCGFGSEETMRRSFLRVLGVAPQDYRARFTV